MVEFFTEIPTGLWIILGVIIIAVVFGDKGIWEYEVEFAPKDGVGHGEIEFKCSQKKGTHIEINLTIESAWQHKPIDILLNGENIFRIEAEKNTKNRLYIKQPFTLAKPNADDNVVVKADKMTLFSGKLVRD